MNSYYLECISCGAIFNEVVFKCPKCGSLPVFRYLTRKFEICVKKPGIWRYSSNLPPVRDVVSRGEGLTPISKLGGVLVKNEKFNPTGTYSDRASSVIASYFLTNRISRVATYFEEDFTHSLAYYLSGISELEVLVREVLSLNVAELGAILNMGGSLTTLPNGNITKYLDYVNPLTVEGLKTIAFEIVEKKIKVERIVVPVRSGVLAYSVYKGVRELVDAGVGIPYEVVAAMVKGESVPYITKLIKGIKFIEVGEEDVLESIVKLDRKGIKTKPISALAYAVAENLGKAVVVMTMGFKTTSYYGQRNVNVRGEVYRIVKEAGEVTAYGVWKKAPVYTLRGIYKLLHSMERRGEVCSEVVYEGSRKVKYYRLCK